MVSLIEPGEPERRRSLLDAPHMRPLAPFLADLRRRFGEVPDPDPLDGGAAARLLLLLETPGPRVRDTGFVSLDNPSGTSRNLRAFLHEAGLSRSDILIWNAVPFIIHAPGAANRAPKVSEMRAGLSTLPALLALMPNLSAVILAGRIARGGMPVLAEARPGLPVFAMPHPSPTIQCTSPEMPARCRAAFAAAASILAHPTRSAA